MLKPLKLNQKNDGFMIIIALIIFSITIMYGIMIHKNTLETHQSMTNYNNYMRASLIADSVSQFLLFEINDHDNGFNSGEIICKHGKNAGTSGKDNPELCNEFAYLDKYYPDDDIEVTLEVKGRATEEEKIDSGKFFDAPYVVPLPGTGDAGDHCDGYKPFEDDDDFVDPTFAGPKSIDHMDFSCNWNKLRFGSSFVDRVVIPLYYDKSPLDQRTEKGEPDIVNPFKDKIKAGTFYLRIRTPCKNKEADCADDQRYELDSTTKDDIVVQWQLNGQCATTKKGQTKDEECGLVAIPKGTDVLAADVSGIYESMINGGFNKQNIVLQKNTKGYDINTKKAVAVGILQKKLADEPATKLQQMSKPTVALLLYKPLLTSFDQKRIPYLEYQVLTDHPVGNSKITMKVMVAVDGNAFVKTLEKQIRRPLIDFAIHN